MKKYQSPGKFAGNWEIQVQAPLDDRQVVEQVSDLTTSSTWLSSDGNYYHYKEMLVVCEENNTVYIYIGETGNSSDVEKVENWMPVGSSSLISYKTDDVVLPSYYRLVALTKSEYDALEVKDPHTLYFITDNGNLINTAGDSAYELWLKENNYTASQHPVSEFLNFLKVRSSEWIGTKEQFNSLASLDSATIYYITE